MLGHVLSSSQRLFNITTSRGPGLCPLLRQGDWDFEGLTFLFVHTSKALVFHSFTCAQCHKERKYAGITSDTEVATKMSSMVTTFQSDRRYCRGFWKRKDVSYLSQCSSLHATIWTCQPWHTHWSNTSTTVEWSLANFLWGLRLAQEERHSCLVPYSWSYVLGQKRKTMIMLNDHAS